MATNFKMQPVRGVRDIYGNNIKIFRHVIEAARKVSLLNNYQEISLPIFEFSEIFNRTLGETSDVVSKETYTFIDREKTSITLRPEFTAGIVRSVISNGLTQSLPIKYFSYGPVFRHERPQKARYRQFHQINFEYIGIEYNYSDIELIILAHSFLKSLNIIDTVKLQISTLGDVQSRNNYKKELFAYLSQYESDLSEDSKIRLYKNPLRILDSKSSEDQKILLNAPKIYDHLTPQAIERFEGIKNSLSDLSINFEINPNLVRGLDYYTHTVFEFITDKLGSQGTVLAGGRYDGLFETMEGPSIPAIGFAAGIERLSELVDLDSLQTEEILLFLIPIGQKALSIAPWVARQIREFGLNVDYIYHDNTAKQMQKANKSKATHTLIFGDDEIANNNYRLKNMNSGEEQFKTIEDLKIIF